MLVARYSANIQSDIQRGWSSWNFGQDGFEGTEQEFKSFLAQATDEDSIFISGFEMYASDVRNGKFGKLYDNYWVVIDTLNARGGLSCWKLTTNNLQEARTLALTNQNEVQSTESSFDPTEAKLLWSECADGEIGCHIFELED